MRRAVLAALLALSTGCAAHGSARTFRPDQLSHQQTWLAVRGVPFVHQATTFDCGAAAVTMVGNFWGPPATLAEMAAALPAGEASAGELRDLLRARGLHAFVIAGDIAGLREQLGKNRPILVGVVKRYSRSRGVSHFEVVIGYDEARQRILFLDPAAGWREESVVAFLSEWESSGRAAIVAFP